MFEKVTALPNPQKIILAILTSIFLYGISTLASFFITKAFLANSSFLTPISQLVGETSENQPGNVPCQLNGVGYSQAQAERWESRRPLGVMVENHVDARPQSGLSRADVIYEAVAEGGITRFLVIYYCQDAGDITPVRSARTYYLDWLSEYDAAYAHVGGANTPGPANALGQIRQYQIKDLDQFGLGFPTYWRGTDRFAPHNVHTTTEKLWEAAAERGWEAADSQTGKSWNENFRSWKFKEDLSPEQRTDQEPVIVEFWRNQPAYTVTWKYNKEKNTYARFHGEQVQIDPLTEEEVAAKVVVVQFQRERNANDGYPGNSHLLYDTTGTGDALIFQDGKVIEGTWQKADRTSRTLYLDKAGAEIEFNRGLIFIQTVPIGANITY